MDQEKTDGSQAEVNWPTLSADDALSRSVARSLTLDTQRASADGKLLEMSSQVELIRVRLQSLEQNIFESATSRDLDESTLERFSSFESSVAETSARFSELTARVAEAEERFATATLSSADGFDTRIAMVEDARIAQTTELNELTGYLEQAFTRITELAEVIEDHRAKTAESLRDAHDHSESLEMQQSMSEIETAVVELSRQTQQSGALFDSRVQEIELALTAPLTELDARVSVQSDKLIEHGEQIRGLDSRLTDTESQLHENRTGSGAQDDRLATIEGHLANELENQRNSIAQQSEVIDAVGEAIEAHSRALKAQGEVLDSQSASIHAYDGAIQAQSDAVRAYDATLDAHEDTLATQSQSLQAQSEQLEGQRRILDTQQRSVSEHAASLEAHSRSIEALEAESREGRASGESLQEQSNVFAAIDGVLESQSESIDTHGRILEAQSDTLTAHNQTLEAHQDSIRANQETIGELRSLLDDDSTNSSELSTIAANVESASDTASKASQQTLDNCDRISVVAGTADLVGQRVDLVEHRVDEVAARTAEAVDSATSELTEVKTAVDGLGQRFEQTAQSVDDMQGRIRQLENNDAPSHQVHEQIEATNSRVIDIASATHELGTSLRSEHLDIKSEHDAIKSEHDAIKSEHDAIKSGHDAIQVETNELRAEQDQLKSRTSEIQTEAAEIRETVETLTQVEAQNIARLEQRIAQSAETLQEELVQRFEHVETQFSSASAEASNDAIEVANAANTSAEHAQQLATQLRAIQAEFVKTIQSELIGHADRLSGLEGSVGSTTNQLSAFADSQSQNASAERVQQLEGKLVEALQTISQLTQLQRRHTTVESQITDALTATTQGIEHTQQHVVSLRGQLTQADSRIERLESAFAAISGQPAPVVPQPAAVSASDTSETVAPTADAAEPDTDGNAVTDDADTDWFNASYERRNAS